jgi:type IV pilus assembly protein PilE
MTVIEVLVTMAVLAVIVAIAIPSYQTQQRKSRRSEAFTALSQIQQAQERHRSTRDSFTSNITAAPSASVPGLGQPTTTSSGYYTLSIASAAATGYVATAAAVAGTSQANDGPCATLAVWMSGGNVRYGAGSTIDWTSTNTDPQRCWAR